MRIKNKFFIAVLSVASLGLGACATKEAPPPPVILKKEAPALSVQRILPQSARLNTDFTYTLKVTNKSDYKIDDAIVTELIPKNFEISKVVPATTERAGSLTWNLGIMIPGQTEVITITGKPRAVGNLDFGGNASTAFNLKQMLVFTEVIAPEISLVSSGPEEALSGDQIPIVLTVKNIGSSPIKNVVLAHNFPDGMTTVTGEKSVKISAGDLTIAQSTNIPINVIATKRGRFINDFSVSADDGVKANTVYSVVVKQPNLDMTAEAPAIRYVGNVITYKIELQNSGNGEAKDLEATLALPAGMRFISANEGGNFENNSVVWNFKDFLPNESKVFTARLISDSIRVVRANAEVKASGIPPKRVPLTTDVQGIPALLIGVEDVNDPVAVGDQETYIVKVSNQGSLAATNVVLTCDIEDSMQFVRSTGPTESEPASRNTSKVVFKSVPTLAPKQELTWNVYIKAVKPGDARFTISVIADQLTRPVSQDESTTFYNE